MADDSLDRTEKVKIYELGAKAKQRIAAQLKNTVATALTLVAALFWQTAIMDTIKTFLPVSGAWFYEIIVALFVTAIAALLLYQLTKSDETVKK